MRTPISQLNQPIIDRAKYMHFRAHMFRARAAQTKEERTQKRLLEVADIYDREAEAVS